MGTSGISLVKLNNEFKVAQYGSFDFYPFGVGFNTIKFIREELDIDDFKTKILNLGRWENHLFGEYQYKDIYPELSTETGGEIYKLINNGTVKKICLSLNKVSNSLFCRWGYSINLDENTFDCFVGHNQTLLTPEQPFYYLQKEDKEYNPIKQFLSIPFNQLNTINSGKDLNDIVEDILEPNKLYRNGIPKKWDKVIF